MLSIGFVVTPGFPVMSLAALSVFEFANFSAEKTLYDIHVLSEGGGPIPSASGTSLQTTAFGDRRFDTIIIGGNTRRADLAPAARVPLFSGEDVASALLHLHRRVRACGCSAARQSPRDDALAFH
jgi:transcriptional regulator GlxA family with amidase domain